MPLTLLKTHPLLAPGLILLAGLIMFPLFTVAYAGYTAHQQQRQWCTLLVNITANAPPPPVVAKPGPGASLAQRSAYRNYEIYRDLSGLRESFGCH